MSEFKNMKFKTNSDEETIKLQKYLFSLGYEWKSYGKGLKFIYTRYFLTCDNGVLYGTDEKFFNYNKSPEYSLEEIITYELKEVEKEFEQFEVFDKLIEINKIGREKHFSNISNLEYIKLCTVTFNYGRRKGHTSYIKSRFNPETDILVVINNHIRTLLYKNLNKNKIHCIENSNWMRGYNFSNIKNIWIDNYSVFNKDEVNEFYKNLACKKFDKNLTIIGIG